MEFFGEEHLDEQLFIEFAKFEERQKEVRRKRKEEEGGGGERGRCLREREMSVCCPSAWGDDDASGWLIFGFCWQYDRARVIFKYALEKIPKAKAKQLFDNYTSFEKKYGDRKGVETVILNKRRFQYEQEVSPVVFERLPRKPENPTVGVWIR